MAEQTPLDLRPHPITGASYIIVMPFWLPPADEIRRSYQLHECEWLRVIDGSQFRDAFLQLRDQRVVFLYWFPNDIPEIPGDRQATVVPVYYEVVERDLDKLVLNHAASLGGLVARAAQFDGILTHTPISAAIMAAMTGSRTGALPVGMESRVLGVPRWDEPKLFDAIWYGSLVGRRIPVVQSWAENPSWRFRDASGSEICDCGPAIVEKLQASKTCIDLKHTDVEFASTWRIWQNASSSTAIVAEPGDRWPLGAGDYVAVPTITAENAVDVVRSVLELSEEEALAISRSAHEHLHEYNTRRCIDEFIVEQTMSWIR